MKKPKLEWHQLLESAPFFVQAIHEVVDDDTDITKLHPLLRAAIYYDIFDGEISNGGVSQYFYNQALSLDDFERVPEYIAANPVFSPAMQIINEVHTAWASCADDVRKAHDNDDEYPDKLFKKYAPRFDALETQFYAIHHKISSQFNLALLQNPHAYFDLTPIAGVPKKGVAYVNTHKDSKRFRFKDGFPVGPNIFEKKDGTYFLTRFSDSREVMECIDDPKHYWIHYPSGRSVDMTFTDDKLDMFKTEFDFRQNDGVYEWFNSTGSLKSSTLYQLNEQKNEVDYYPNGKVGFTSTTEKQSKVNVRFWPDGSLNTKYVEAKNGGIRVLKCLDETGKDLAPNGNGKFYEFVSEVDKKRSWFEGEIKEGKLIGYRQSFTKNLITGKTKKG